MFPNQEICTVYHGTNLFAAKAIQHHGIWLNAQRRQTDFGKGFYLTFNRSQAKSWAVIRAMHAPVSSQVLEQLNMGKAQYFENPDTSKPAYVAFRLDLRKLKRLDGWLFPLPLEPRWRQYEQSWKAFVQACRSGKRHTFDYVYGPIGGGHLTDSKLVKVSATKEQLSLNTPKAIGCLASSQIITFKPEQKMTAIPALHPSRHSLSRSNAASLFLREVRDQVMSIGQLSLKQANQRVRKSWIASNFNPIMMHEEPSYWAFSVLFRQDELWLEDFERYQRAE
ncbi:DUF3990 domain-containing protein [Shouchella shacheensis]|uniref:DUF3990 domain-containing protein n=1 Tax=Shouchella shacheensis TaxID=1649580 RepID=UPI0007400117|nr:DUF3990 domain-containing protein [Shouchella shacheensis]